MKDESGKTRKSKEGKLGSRRHTCLASKSGVKVPQSTERVCQFLVARCRQGGQATPIWPCLF
jgi:hypothetical protein